MRDLSATLRLQFHRDFTLDDATALVDYFADLGISHLYASPLLTARPGSMHGYDVIDPTTGANVETVSLDVFAPAALAVVPEPEDWSMHCAPRAWA